MEIPEAVFLSSFELLKPVEDSIFTEAVGQLMAEDPSFVYEKDEETGQHVLKGLGELHL